MGKSYRDLTVWQRAMQLTTQVYRLTQAFPKEEQFGLTNQLRRSAVSVPSNIAEGQGRSSTKDFCQFLSIARGSNNELRTQLEIARNLGFGEPKLIDESEILTEEISKMLFSLIDSLKINEK